MVEHREVALPQQVEMAKELLTRLGDYSAMTDEDDDVVSNIRALANLFVSIGTLAVLAGMGYSSSLTISLFQTT